MSLQTQLGEHAAAVVAGPFPQYVNVGSVGYINNNRDSGVELACVPPDWQALDTPCDTCGGQRWVSDLGHQDGCEGVYCEQMCPVQVQAACPDCRGTGRKVHTITVDCQHLIVKTWGLGDQCIRCLGEGTVSVDVTVRLVQAVDGWSNVVAPECIVIADGNAYWCLGNNNWERGAKEVTVLGDPLTPGDFVAIIERMNE